MIWTRRQLLAAAGIAAASPSLAWAEADTQPLWLLRKGDAKVYLYGNAGSPAPKWSAPRVEAAFAESAVFWKETPDGTPADRAKFAVLGVDSARPLSTWLTADERERVRVAAEEAGTTYAALEPLKPWLAGFVLSQAFSRRKPKSSSEDPLPILTARAKATGKPIRTEFPDTAAQLDWITAMPQAAQVEYLFYTIENYRIPQEVVDRRRRAWAAGDLSLETRQVRHLKADFPNLYEPIEAGRNRGWPPRFRKMLDDGGTSFVMVGADHLVGPDSLLIHLAKAGLSARRI